MRLLYDSYLETQDGDIVKFYIDRDTGAVIGKDSTGRVIITSGQQEGLLTLTNITPQGTFESDDETSQSGYPTADSTNATNATQTGNGSASGPAIAKYDAWTVVNTGGFFNNNTEFETGDLIVAIKDEAEDQDNDWLVIKNGANFTFNPGGAIETDGSGSTFEIGTTPAEMNKTFVQNGAANTYTMPTSPVKGQKITLANQDGNTLTYQNNGNDMDGADSGGTIGVSGTFKTFQFDGTQWVTVGGNV